MPMSPHQKQKFEAWLAAHVPQPLPACAMCGSTRWDTGEVIDSSGMSGIIAPMVQLICQTCGHIMLFDARKIGVV